MAAHLVKLLDEDVQGLTAAGLAVGKALPDDVLGHGGHFSKSNHFRSPDWF